MPTTAVPSAVPTVPVTPSGHALGWSDPLTTLPPGGGFTSLSCISSTFCVAAGGGANAADQLDTAGSGVTVSWDGAAWSAPSVYFPAPAGGPVGAPISPAIGCTGGPFCLVVDGTLHASTGNGTTWSTPATVATGTALPPGPSDPGPGHAGSRSAAVSCPLPSFCAVVDNTGAVAVLANGGWLAGTSFGTGSPGSPADTALFQSGRVGVACPSSSSCTAAVGSAVLDWDGTHWSKEPLPWTTGLPAPTGAVVGCPSVGLSAILSGATLSVRSGAGGWSAPQTIDPAGGLDAVSCPTATFCLAADVHGSVLDWAGGSWSAPVEVLPAATEYTGDPTSVACSSPQFCMVMNGDGDYATFSGTTLAQPGGLSAVPGPTG